MRLFICITLSKAKHSLDIVFAAKYSARLDLYRSVLRSMLGNFGYRVVAEHKGRYNADTWLVTVLPP